MLLWLVKGDLLFDTELVFAYDSTCLLSDSYICMVCGGLQFESVLLIYNAHPDFLPTDFI
jgi:hypothetical protein